MLNTVRDVCKYIGSQIDSSPFCVETGTSYCIQPENLIHTTTNNIVEYICKPNEGHLVSLDIDSEHQDLASSICDNSYVTFWLGDSVETLNTRALRQIDVLCLDSKEFDEGHAVKEFRAVEPFLKPNRHFVLVDDIHNTNSVKWKKVVPILKSLDYKYVEVDTPTGLFFATKGYDL